jgi:hypothetical protein
MVDYYLAQVESLRAQEGLAATPAERQAIADRIAEYEGMANLLVASQNPAAGGISTVPVEDTPDLDLAGAE